MKNEPINRELDAWIALNVFGWKLTNYETGKPASTPEDYEDASKNDGWTWDGTNEAWEWQPTTDPAAALEVLKRCAMKIKFVNIRIVTDGTSWRVFSDLHSSGDQPTYELAIATFAMELFK